MRPLLIDVADHQVHLVRQRDVAADEILTRVNRLKLRRGPIADAGSGRIREELHECETRGTEQVRRDFVARETAGNIGAGVAYAARNVRQVSGKWATEIAGLLSRCRHSRRKHRAAFLTPPLFRPEEEHSVLDDWTTEVAAEVVVLQLRFRLSRTVQEEAVGIQRIVAEELKNAAVKVV